MAKKMEGIMRALRLRGRATVGELAWDLKATRKAVAGTLARMVRMPHRYPVRRAGDGAADVYEVIPDAEAGSTVREAV